jgi:hypothetical protein
MLPNFFTNVSHVAECTIKNEEKEKITIEYTHYTHLSLRFGKIQHNNREDGGAICWGETTE